MISTVIITRNEAHNIEACIRSAQTVSADVIVVDCGSKDETVGLARKAGARVVVVDWQCYGHSRNTGAGAAKHDWILSLDADERISPSLATALRRLDLSDVGLAYKITRKNYFTGKQLRFGTLGFETITRLYNRRHASWDLFPVHEKLQGVEGRRLIREPLLHFGIPDYGAWVEKRKRYALLSAFKYRQQGKKASLLKRFVSPLFNAAKSYVFQAGFLDGKEGWLVARTIFYYTWLKYDCLFQMQAERAEKIPTPKPVPSPALVQEGG